ncbi:hypothetical protein [Enterobacter asburiae]|nr:hypothetical protein [Enterobacter asburiae]
MKDLTQLLSSLKRLMVADHYPLASPVAPEVLKDLICNPPPVEWADHKKSAYIDIQKLIKTRLDYAQVFNAMDGFEYNGLTFYNLVQAE